MLVNYLLFIYLLPITCSFSSSFFVVINQIEECAAVPVFLKTRNTTRTILINKLIYNLILKFWQELDFLIRNDYFLYYNLSLPSEVIKLKLFVALILNIYNVKICCFLTS